MEIVEVKSSSDHASLQKIKGWIKDKQINEQRMLQQLNALFDHPLVYQKVRRVVRLAFEIMWLEVQNTGPCGPVSAAILEEKNLAVWQTLAPPTSIPHFMLERMLYKLRPDEEGPSPLNCGYLAELVRVIGAWLEKGGGYASRDINKAYRVGVDKISKSAPHGKGSAVGQQDAIDGKIWNKREVRQRAGQGGVKGFDIPDHLIQFWVRPSFGRNSGMEFFQVNANDMCKRIDLLYGLLKGATISGTTTDTVLVLEAFGAPYNLHAGYYLFPVATIAASLHHTLLEAGLALTLDDAIDSYCAGFYTTLIPKYGLPSELSGAEGILRTAEEHPDNRHMIIWYDKGNESSPAGCIHFNRKFEKASFKRLVEARGLMTHVMKLPPVPSKKDVAGFINLLAPKLLAYLPQEFQPARLRMH